MKFKKLLAAAMAATMILSSMVTSFVASAASAGTITAGTVDKVVGETDTVAVDVTIDLGAGVVAPHNIVKVALDGYTLTDVTLGDVVYAEDSAEGKVTINEESKNLAEGKVLFETPVDNKAPTVTKIVFTATFTDADDTDTAEGTYAIVVSADDMTNVKEESLELTATNGKLVVAHACVAGEAVTENNVDPTCDAAGSYDTVTYCVTCNKELSRETTTVEALGHAYDDGVIDPDATCDSDGVKTFTCANCGDTYTEAVSAKGHTFENGTCTVCGAADPDAPVGPAIDTNITIKPYIYYGSEIGVMFQLTKAQLDKYATYELVIDRQVYDTKYMLDDAETVVVPKAQVLNNTKKSPYYIIKGIGMYELGLNVSAYINCYNANGELIAKSDTWSDSVATVIKQAYTTASDLYKTLIADTLNMSAAAQKYFGQLPANVNSDLAKAPFVNADDPNYDFVASDYASKTTGELNAVENPITYNPNSPISTSSHYLMNSLIFGKSIGVTYLLRDSNSALDLSKLEIEVSYTSLYPAGTVTPTVERPLIVNRAGKWIQVSFEGVYLYDTNKVVTATIKYDGKEVLTTNYTVDTYCKAQLSSSDANTAALADATAKFGNSARAYFSNQTGYQV